MNDVQELLVQYRTVLVEMHEARVETGAKPRRWNRLVDKMQALHLQLRESDQGRDGISDLAFNGENDTVRAWSAANALAWDAKRVRPLIEARAAEDDLGGLDAEMVLREFDAGRLTSGWLPNWR